MDKIGRKVLVYLSSNEEIIQEINNNGVLVEYNESNPRYEVRFNYFLGILTSLTKKDLITNKIDKISLFRILLQKFNYLTEYSDRNRIKTINDSKDETIRELLESFIIV